MYDRCATKTIKYIADNAATISKNPACFYSGQMDIKGKTITMYTRITKFQEKIGHNCNVVSDLVPAAGQMWQNPEWPICPDWSKMSQQFTKVVKGTVYVLLGTDVCDTSHWKVLEHPILKNNWAVTRIEVFELNMAREIVAKYHDINTPPILFRPDPDPSFPSISFKFPAPISFTRISQKILALIQLLLFNK